jgi:archaellum component FlaC
MMMYVSVFKLNERKNNAKQIAVLKQEIDGLGATNQAKQLAKQAAEKNAMVNKLISTVRHKALHSKNERLNSTKEKLTKAEDILEENEEQIASLKSEVQDMAQEIETLVKEMEKLNKLRVEEIQKTYDSYIGYLNTEKKSREQEVKEAQVALDKEMQALEQTTRKLEQTVADKSKHQALDNGEDVSVSNAGEFQAPGEEDEELDE